MISPKYLNTNYLTNSIASALSYINYSGQIWQGCSNSLNLFLTIDLKMSSLQSFNINPQINLLTRWMEPSKNKQTNKHWSEIIFPATFSTSWLIITSLWSWPWAAQWLFHISFSLLWSLKFCLHRILCFPAASEAYSFYSRVLTSGSLWCLYCCCCDGLQSFPFNIDPQVATSVSPTAFLFPSPVSHGL